MLKARLWMELWAVPCLVEVTPAHRRRAGTRWSSWSLLSQVHYSDSMALWSLLRNGKVHMHCPEGSEFSRYKTWPKICNLRPSEWLKGAFKYLDTGRFKAMQLSFPWKWRQEPVHQYSFGNKSTWKHSWENLLSGSTFADTGVSLPSDVTWASSGQHGES